MKYRTRSAQALCAVLLTAGLTLTGPALASSGLSIAASSNMGTTYPYYTDPAHAYPNEWGAPADSFLTAFNGGLLRVEHISGQVVAELYNRRYELTAGTKLPMELPLWGGFFCGEDYFFLIFGQENPDQDPDREVIRVVRYDHSWNRIDHASVLGRDTVLPFSFGGLSCVEQDGILHIRTCHQSFAGPEGLNHQSSLMFSIREQDMAVLDSFDSLEHSGMGYVSHSFQTHLLMDGENRLVALDHGDAYPRAAVLVRYEPLVPDGEHWTGAETVELTQWSGPVGISTTGALVTGLAETETGYLSVWSETGKGSDSLRGDPQTVRLAYTPKHDFSTAATVVSTLGQGLAPRLVPTGPDRGYVLWTGMEGGVQYAAYNGYGTVGEIGTEPTAALSDCQPVLYDGNLVWYVTDDSTPVFYTLTGQGIRSDKATLPGGVPVLPSTSAFVDVPMSAWYSGYVNLAAEAGLLDGVGDNRFDPDGTVSVGQVVTLTARLHSERTHRAIPADRPGEKWYDGEYRYCLDNGLISEEEYPEWMLDRNATRLEMVQVLDSAISEEEKKVLKAGAGPLDMEPGETGAEVVYSWYRAGILTGDQFGIFNGAGKVQRSELATVLCRLDGLVERVVNRDRRPESR